MKIQQHKNTITVFLLLAVLLSSFASSDDHQAVEIVNLDFVIHKQLDGDSLISSCNKSEKYCNGVGEWSDGTNYEGEFQYGIPHGKGVMKWPNNNTYTGQFESGLRQGFGSQSFSDGSTYEGNWVAGKKEGQGYLIYANGDEYLGEFKKDQIDGEGAILWSNGESYSGFWKNGKRHGMGTYVRNDGSKYSGMSVEGERHGEGFIAWETRDTLFGNWQNGIMDKEGVFQFADGSSMISYWENGKIVDKTTYVQPNGFKVSASAKQLANLVVKTSMGKAKAVEDNLGLAFYAIGLEFKSTNDFENAEHYLQFAMQFKDPLEENSGIFEMVEIQMASLASERESSGLIKVKLDEEKKE